MNSYFDSISIDEEIKKTKWQNRMRKISHFQNTESFKSVCWESSLSSVGFTEFKD
jgi:hypothetical protein